MKLKQLYFSKKAHLVFFLLSLLFLALSIVNAFQIGGQVLSWLLFPFSLFYLIYIFIFCGLVFIPLLFLTFVASFFVHPILATHDMLPICGSSDPCATWGFIAYFILFILNIISALLNYFLVFTFLSKRKNTIQP